MPRPLLCSAALLAGAIFQYSVAAAGSKPADPHCDDPKHVSALRDVSPATRQLFAALDTDGTRTVSTKYLLDFLDAHGLQRSDPRLADFFEYIRAVGGANADVRLSVQQFAQAIAHSSTLLHKIFEGRLKVPDFQAFADTIREVYQEVLPNVDGANADYIPQLAEVDPDQFGISVTTVDGQQFNIGDSDVQFCIQSCSKPLSYLIAQSMFGAEYVHRSVGTEPSGHKFNEMVLKDAPTPEYPGRQIPHNPMINAGAIMAASMVHPELPRAERLEKVMNVWRELSGGAGTKGGSAIGYDDATYRSESATADRNWCLGYMMKEKKAFPPCFTNLTETLEIYFQICSILSTSSAMSVMAATLANGGLNPLSGARVFATEHVRNVLPLMLTSGMYDYSGQWAYDIGVPAKSGVGGCVFIVIPNVCGIAIWSPRLDQVGNSARGVAVAKALVNRFQFHNFEVFSGLSATKTDPTLRRNAAQEAALFSVLFAASEGDEAQLAQLHNAGVSLAGADYDSRTALHLAASEGHSAVLRFLVGVLPTTDSAVFSPVDRWGGTPLSDAIAHSHVECVRILREAGAQPGTATPAAAAAAGGPGRADAEQGAIVKSREISRALFAAAAGDLDELVVLRVDGADLSLGDYDRRTALHLAASNGHPDIVRYLLAQAGDGRDELIAAKDRWGNTALDDATRERVRYASGTPGRAQFDRCGELLSE